MNKMQKMFAGLVLCAAVAIGLSVLPAYATALRTLALNVLTATTATITTLTVSTRSGLPSWSTPPAAHSAGDIAYDTTLKVIALSTVTYTANVSGWTHAPVAGGTVWTIY